MLSGGACGKSGGAKPFVISTEGVLRRKRETVGVKNVRDTSGGTETQAEVRQTYQQFEKYLLTRRNVVMVSEEIRVYQESRRCNRKGENT